MWKRNLNGKAMKRLGKILSIMALAITSSVAISCTEEINAPSDKEAEGTIIREFTASFETPTKTFIEEGGKVSWCKGDTIWYYTENRGETRYVVIEEDCESATINMTMNEDAEFIIAYYGGNDGGYNYSDFVSLENIVNDIQNGRFVDAHTSVAVCSDLESENLFFRNVTSLLKFSLKREDIRYVNISSKDHTPLHSYGEVFMSFFDEEIYRDYNGYYGYDIRVDLNGSGVYYAGIFPTYFKNGLRFDFLDKDMNFKGHIDIDKPIEVSENEIINFGELDSRIIEVDDSETVIYIVDHLDKGKNQQTFTPDKKHLFNVLPDYERNVYVYKYATCISAASAIVKRIETEGEAYIEQYLSFLKAGGSRSPLESLALAGIDMTSPTVIEGAIADFSEAVAAFRRIYNGEAEV